MGKSMKAGYGKLLVSLGKAKQKMKNEFVTVTPFEGLKIVSYQTDRFKTGRLAVNLVLPLTLEPETYAVLPYLFTKTTAAYPSFLDLSKRLAELYGAILSPAVTKMGENLVLRLSITMLDNRFTFDGEDLVLECTKLLCDALYAPLLKNGLVPEEDLKREQRLLKERLEADKNDKRTYARDRLIELMCEDEVYRVNPLGTEEGIDAMTPETVTEAWRELLRVARIQVNVVGSTDPNKVADLVAGYVTSVTRAEQFADFSNGLKQEVTAEKRVTEVQDIAQGKLVLGFRTGIRDTEADYARFRVFSDLFGGGPHSRLFKNVREAQSLCYYCSARVYSKKGIMLVQSGIENENAQKAVDSILHELKELQDGNFTDADLETSHKYLMDGFRSVCDKPEELDGWMYMAVCDQTFLPPEEVAKKLKAVTRDDVVEAARSIRLDTVFLLEGTGKEDQADA